LRDRKKVPLLVVIDTEITESAKFADYILPETTYLERWDICEVASGIPTKALGVRQPVVGYFHHKTGRYIPIFPKTKVMEDIFIQIAKKLNLPGFGKDGFEKGRPLENAWEYYRRFITMLTSRRYGFGVPVLNNDHRLQFVLSRGGIFEPYEKAYQRKYARYRYRGLCKIYNEELGKSKDSLTGKTYDGFPRYEPIDRFKYDKDFPLKLISYRLPYHSMMRTAQNRWILELLPQNYVMINPRDAKRYGIRTGDIVKVQSRNSAVIGQAMVRQGIMPGVVGIPYGFGNRECGAGSVKIDGKATSFDHTRGKGVTILPVATRDPVTKLGPLQDPIGGNVAINDTWVRLLKV